MTSDTSLLDEALESWQYARDGVIAEVDNLEDEQLRFRPTDSSRSVTELVQHVVEVGLMMSGELTRSDGDFRRQPFSQFIEEYAGELRFGRSKDTLLEVLRRTHAQGAKHIREAGELFMLQFIRRFDGEQGTRLAWLQHGIAHEEYHRGQLALYARLLGRVPALTKKITGT